ncbi:Protein of unknown function [Gryllus bimaculatus]|nr:Protein of unknown function [Gryllus bimaculatus]
MIVAVAYVGEQPRHIRLALEYSPRYRRSSCASSRRFRRLAKQPQEFERKLQVKPEAERQRRQRGGRLDLWQRGGGREVAGYSCGRETEAEAWRDLPVAEKRIQKRGGICLWQRGGGREAAAETRAGRRGTITKLFSETEAEKHGRVAEKHGRVAEKHSRVAEKHSRVAEKQRRRSRGGYAEADV